MIVYIGLSWYPVSWWLQSWWAKVWHRSKWWSQVMVVLDAKQNKLCVCVWFLVSESLVSLCPWHWGESHTLVGRRCVNLSFVMLHFACEAFVILHCVHLCCLQCFEATLQVLLDEMIYSWCLFCLGDIYCLPWQRILEGGIVCLFHCYLFGTWTWNPQTLMLLGVCLSLLLLCCAHAWWFVKPGQDHRLWTFSLCAILSLSLAY